MELRGCDAWNQVTEKWQQQVQTIDASSEAREYGEREQENDRSE